MSAKTKFQTADDGTMRSGEAHESLDAARYAGAAPARSLSRAGAAVLQCLLIAGLWLATRPYQGVIHDARLYTVQALAGAGGGDDLRSDLFLAYGSQDSFTLFSALYRPLLLWLGVGPGHFVAAVAGQILWLCGLVFLARAVFGRALAVWVIAAVIVLSPAYGGMSILEYGEKFASPRIFSEALILFAIAFAHRRQAWRACGLALCAAALHPLMSAPGFGVVFILLAWNRRWLWALPAVGIVVFAALAFAHVAPFDRALMRLDGEWLAVTWQRCAYSFFTQWRIRDYLDLAGKLSFMMVGLALARPAERRLTWAVLAVAVLGLAVNLLGAELADDVLAVNLQLWRSMWLLALLANAWAAVIFLRLPETSLARAVLLVFALVAAATHLLMIPDLIGGALAIAASALAIYETRAQADVSPRAAMIVKTVLAIVAGAFVGFVILFLRFRAGTPNFAAATIAGVAALLMILLVLAKDRAPRRIVAALSAVLIAAILYGADRRTEWTRFVESGRVPDELASFVADSGTSYVESGVEMNWLLLRRANYYSCLQGAGVMFYPGTAAEYARRRNGLAPLETYDFIGDNDGMCGPKKDEARGPASLATIAGVCRALPDLQTLFLTTRVPGTNPREWRAPSPQVRMQSAQVEQAQVWYRYACPDLR